MQLSCLNDDSAADSTAMPLTAACSSLCELMNGDREQCM
jgi:hypothetical protein